MQVWMATINDWGAFLSKHNLTSDMLLSDNLSISATEHNSQMKDALIKGFLYESYCLPKYMIHAW